MVNKEKSAIIGKKQISENIHNNLIKKKIRLSKTDIEQVINELLEETKKGLAKGNEVRFVGYYSFKTAITKPRTAMNLATKKKMTVPAKRVPKIKFSADFKEEISKKK